MSNEGTDYRGYKGAVVMVVVVLLLIPMMVVESPWQNRLVVRCGIIKMLGE